MHLVCLPFGYPGWHTLLSTGALKFRTEALSNFIYGTAVLLLLGRVQSGFQGRSLSKMGSQPRKDRLLCPEAILGQRQNTSQK